jgi:translocation and assembly module TamA
MVPIVRLFSPIVIICLLFLAACGRASEQFPTLSRTETTQREGEDLVKSDPFGPIPKPQMPVYQASDPDLPQGSLGPVEVIKYQVQTHPNDIAVITDIFIKTAELYTLADKPVLNPMTLTRRLRSSLEKGHDILQSLGYFEGTVNGWLEKKDDSPLTTAVINFIPGPMYHLGTGKVTAITPEEKAAEEKAAFEKAAADKAAAGISPAASDPVHAVPPVHPVPPDPALRSTAPAAPDKMPTTDLLPAGWTPGAPAAADDVQTILDQNTLLWAAQGYPLAKIYRARHFLDPEKKLLNSEVTVDPGPFHLMGPLEVSGQDGVELGYMENLVTWKVGQVWNQSLVDRFVDSMFQSGLFKTVDTAIGPMDKNGHYPVVVTVADAPLKTVSGSINYDSDFGPGLVLGWENRNFTGWGDRLRLEFPIWKDLLQLGASYVRPYFLSRNQNLLVDLALIHENADAYTLSAISSAVGLERRLSRRLSALFQVSLEAGYLEEFLLDKTSYRVVGLPVTLDWDYTDDLLNASRGTRVKITAQPFFGNYFSEFEILKSRLDISHYFPIVSEDRLVFAVRGAAGGIWGAERSSYPSTLRFFGGGGGSMRGYEYQSVGPRNERGKPDGGGAMAEVSGEVRWRWSETMGATVFVDGGMVYDKPDVSQLGQNFLWGGGIGFRYFTPIGPFRLDLATPLTPRDEDGPIQFYLSLGQSF